MQAREHSGGSVKREKTRHQGIAAPHHSHRMSLRSLRCGARSFRTIDRPAGKGTNLTTAGSAGRRASAPAPWPDPVDGRARAAERDFGLKVNGWVMVSFRARVRDSIADA
jgi:hypothetical protein